MGLNSGIGYYLPIFKTALVTFPLVALVFSIPYALWNYHKYGSLFSSRVFIIYSFILYLTTCLFLVWLPLPSRAEVAATPGPAPILEPFAFLKNMLYLAEGFNADDPSTWHTLLNTAFWQYVFNVLMLVPFGMYLHYYFKCGFWKTLLFSFLLSLFFEISQLTGLFHIYAHNYRTFEMDDLIANTLGGLVGWIVIWPFIRLLPSVHKMDVNSYRRGQSVSLLRRLAAAFCDVCASALIVAAIAGYCYMKRGIALRQAALYGVLTASALLVLWPLLFKGRSLGMMITRIRVVSTSGRLRYGQIVWRVILQDIFYLLIPAGLIYAIDRLDAVTDALAGTLSQQEAVLLLGAGMIYGALFIITLARMLFHYQPFFGRWSHTEVASSIKIPEQDR